jgi:hypothetical protein
MPAMAEPKLIKVCLTNKGDDTETPWAHDLGAAPGPAGSRKVKLVNVPFMHAKPTWGDVIVVTPVADGFPTWDRDGAAWKQIGARIVEDGGRWAMIVDYAPQDVSADAAFQALGKACDAIKVVCEGAWGPRDADPGRVYLAVQRDLTAEVVMQKLDAARLPCNLIQVHPEPKRSRASTQIGIVIDPPRKPAAPAATEAAKPAKKPAAKKAAETPGSAPVPVEKPAAAPAAKYSVAKEAAAKASSAKAPPSKVPAARGPAVKAAKAPAAKAPAAKAPAATAPAAKAPAATASAAKASAVKAPAVKAPPSKAPAAKAPAAKGPAAKAPAAKAPAAKAPAAKAPAARAPANKLAPKAASKPASKKPAPKKR